MQHPGNPTPQQLVMAACGSVVVAGVMLSNGDRLGFLPLAIAAICGLGAFARSRNR